MEERPLKRARSEEREIATPVLLVKKLSENAKLPERGTAKAAGYDLYSAHDHRVHGDLQVHWPLTDTGQRQGIDQDRFVNCHPWRILRKNCSSVLSCLEESYRCWSRGDWWRLSRTSWCGSFQPWRNRIWRFALKVITYPQVNKGDRVAQLILTKIITPEILEVEELDDTARGEGGFGSTGKAEIVQNSWVY